MILNSHQQFIHKQSRASPLPKTSHPPAPPTEQRTSWFSSYDEEWEAFLAENVIRRAKGTAGWRCEEKLPRVWNLPAK